MKKVLLFFLFYTCITTAQKIPNVELETMDGEEFSTTNFEAVKDKPILISFWATWCIPCINELTFINENFEEWQKKYQFDFYAVAVDDDRTVKKVPTIVNGKNWSFSVLLDTNQDLKRQLNINSIPYFLVIKNGKIIFKKSGFVKGDELQIEKIILNNQ